MSQIKQLYTDEVKQKLMTEFGYKSIMQVPAIKKVTLNMGLGEASADKKIIVAAMEELSRIAGQKPVPTLAKNSIAGFKIREGWPIGTKVTLRKHKMYDFLDRFIAVAIPRIRDFRGFSEKAFDGRGNYSLGIREQYVFSEIEFDQVDAVRGMNVTITTSANSDEEARALLRYLGFPLKGKRGSEDG